MAPTNFQLNTPQAVTRQYAAIRQAQVAMPRPTQNTVTFAKATTPEASVEAAPKPRSLFSYMTHLFTQIWNFFTPSVFNGWQLVKDDAKKAVASPDLKFSGLSFLA